MQPRTGAELLGATREALKRWARVSDKEAAAAARQFLVLYDDLMRYTEMAARQRER